MLSGMESWLTESIVRRARSDSLRAFHSFKFWIVELLASAAAVVVAALVVPSRWGMMWQLSISAAAMVVAPLAVLGFVFAASLVVAPVRQRDEARAAFVRMQEVAATSANYRLRRESQLQNLGSIAKECETLLERSHGTRTKDPKFEDDCNDWRARALEWVESELSVGKAARFERDASGPAPSGTFTDFLPQARRLSARLDMLKTFLKEIDGELSG